MEYNAYVITCLTNLHAGSGDTTFGVVDNLVQRDPVTGHPTIHSPSLKGALREHFKGVNEADETITYIFGLKKTSESQQKDSLRVKTDPSVVDSKKQPQGNYRFFSAHLLSIPVRSDQKPFFMATTSSLISGFIDTLKQFGISSDHKTLDKLLNLKPQKGHPLTGESEAARLEDILSVHSPDMKGLTTILGPDVALFHEEDFKEITTDLPVIARNNLENGESKNLWYEEIVPHQARFFFVVGKGKDYGDLFDKTLKEGCIQIGANASIGYGYTRIRKLNDKGGFDE